VRQYDQNQAARRDPPSRACHHADRSATPTRKFETIAIVKIASQLETHF